MREILFRGKCINNGKWIEGSLLQLDSDKQHVFIIPRQETASSLTIPQIIAMTMERVDPETVCQYTGLTDKNGKKIFEGDIVKFYEGIAPIRFGAYQIPHSEYEFGSDHIGLYVDWPDDSFITKGLGHWASISSTFPMKIVGNVYDNPDLLTTSSTDSD